MRVFWAAPCPILTHRRLSSKAGLGHSPDRTGERRGRPDTDGARMCACVRAWTRACARASTSAAISRKMAGIGGLGCCPLDRDGLMAMLLYSAPGPGAGGRRGADGATGRRRGGE